MPLWFEDLKKGMHVKALCGCEGFIHALEKQPIHAVTVLYTTHCDHVFRMISPHPRDSSLRSYKDFYTQGSSVLINIFIYTELAKMFPLEEIPVPGWWAEAARTNTHIQQLDEER